MLEEFNNTQNQTNDLQNKTQKLEMYVSNLNEENQRLNIDNTQMAAIIKKLQEKCYNLEFNMSNNT